MSDDNIHQALWELHTPTQWASETDDKYNTCGLQMEQIEYDTKQAQCEDEGKNTCKSLKRMWDAP
jgi:hypothetical protein